MFKIKSIIKYCGYCGLLFCLFPLACQSSQESESITTKKEEIVVRNESTSEEQKGLAKAPNFVLKKVSDEKDLALSDFSGKVVIIDFWATWCPPCKAAIPRMNELYKKYHAKGLEIIGISLDNIRNFQDQENLRAFVKKASIAYPIVYATQQVRNNYGGISSIPTLFILNKEGVIVNSFKGFSNEIEAELEKTVQQLL